MKSWMKVPFADLMIESRDGEWGEGKSSVGHQRCEMIRGTDFSGLNDSSIELPQRWIKDHLLDRKRLQVGDIIFEMAGGTAKQSTGRSALLNAVFFAKHNEIPVLCASFCRHLRLDQERFNPEFVYYLLQALYDAGYMAVYNIQHTGVSRFQYTSFKKMTVLDIPLLPIQQKNAAILSAYDDLIENNKRRIALLEKMAEEIYREWFVRLRFPGHEKVKVVKGVPEGWEEKKLNEIVELCYGKALKAEERVSGDYPVFGSSGVVGTHNKPLVKAPGIIVGRKGNVGSVHWTDYDFFPIDTAYYVKSTISLHYLFFLLQSMNFINNDAAVPGLNRNQAYSNLLLLPPGSVINEFSAKAKQLFELKDNLSKQNEQLTQARDSLLPRLISGKLSVENLDIQFPPGMGENSHYPA
jgi:type I restriction enzyme S subunit